MGQQLNATKTVFTVHDFLNRQRDGSLELKPFFQRGEVWKPKEKSLLIDSLVRGLPLPVILLRQMIDTSTLKMRQEVIDGQQRLRTILSFVDPRSLPDWEAQKDEFTVTRIHNSEISGRSFSHLPDEFKLRILNYEISTHIFDSTTSDFDVLLMFARLNSTGARLNEQELRNASYYGAFKTISYELALQNLEFWRKYSIFSNHEVSRQVEVEFTSDLLLNIMRGITGKSKTALDNAYKELDDDLPGSDNLSKRFQKVVDELETSFGKSLRGSQLKRKALFFSLFLACYDHVYGLGSSLTKARKSRPLPSQAIAKFQKLDQMIIDQELPKTVEDAVVKATADKSRRERRHNFFMEVLGFEPPN